jgi:hypothetical protein
MLPGCGGAAPTYAPGGSGVFARHLPVDPAQPDTPADSRSGEVAQADQGWPPTAVVTDCVEGHDELADLEKALGVTTSDACPVFQEKKVHTTVTSDSGGIGKPHPLGHRRDCFVQGHALIVVESTERMSPRCTHVVGVAVYPKGGQ